MIGARPSLLGRRGFTRGALGIAALLVQAPVRAASDALRMACSSALTELAGAAARNRFRLSACVAELETGEVLGDASAHVPQNPASNQKLLTMAVALDRLGPNFRFATSLHGRALGVEALSELVLRGNGDPELSAATLEQLVRSLAEQGVRRVDGDLFVDQSAFDSLWDPPGYEQHPEEWAGYRAPVSAVSLAGNTVTLHVLGSESGPARAWLSPPGIASITGEILSGRGLPQNVRYSVRPRGTEFDVVVGGSVPTEKGELTFARRIENPELAPGRVLRALLAEHGITVAGQVRSGGAEIEAERVASPSRSLAEIIHALGKRSDNFVAEMLLKAVASSDKAGPGSSARGARALEEHLTRLGALDAGSRLGNGSGLYDANRISAYALTRTLVSAYNDPRVAPEFVAALSIGGLDGTLSQRFKAHRTERSVRAKTGTLADAIGLSGYLLTPRVRVAFSVLLNGVNGKQQEARARIDSAVENILRA
ncbi:MAG TPA: D-alanyl-D-alanine carboxypeptidase/D-alanyl-D-alanine-endopeptidase [Polyangiaceae bacterium]|nr:D-alanyl-D-alanine carboxypeptidase/D-alanyl-D-alanine-endopeptidase [Polyangiaceae bacterium]